MPTEHMGDTAKLVGAMMRLHHNTKFRVRRLVLKSSVVKSKLVTVDRTQSTVQYSTVVASTEDIVAWDTDWEGHV